MFESDERKNSRSETMKGRKTIVAIVIFAAISAVGCAFVPTAGAASAGIGGIPEVLNRLDQLIRQVSGLELACTTPDLVPLPLPGVTGPKGFCRLDAHGNLLVRVANQGGAAAGFFTTVVFFKVGGDHSFFATSLPAFGQVDLGLPPGNIPISLCFDSNNECHFTIVVDFDNLVKEPNEINNTVDGVCFRGPL